MWRPVARRPGAADELSGSVSPTVQLVDGEVSPTNAVTRHHCGDRKAKQRPAHDNPEAFFGNGPVSALAPKLQL